MMKYSGMIWAMVLCVALSSCRAKKAPVSAQSDDKQLREISDMLPDNQVDRTADGIRIVFNSAILFDVNSSILTERAKGAIGKLAATLAGNAGTIQINGYTDATGTAEYNVWLSERRAGSVKAELQARGIDPQIIVVKGYGASDPVAPNNTPEGREQNRRVEVIVASGK